MTRDACCYLHLISCCQFHQQPSFLILFDLWSVSLSLFPPFIIITPFSSWFISNADQMPISISYTSQSTYSSTTPSTSLSLSLTSTLPVPTLPSPHSSQKKQGFCIFHVKLHLPGHGALLSSHRLRWSPQATIDMMKAGGPGPIADSIGGVSSNYLDLFSKAKSVRHQLNRAHHPWRVMYSWQLHSWRVSNAGSLSFVCVIASCCCSFWIKVYEKNVPWTQRAQIWRAMTWLLWICYPSQ